MPIARSTHAPNRTSRSIGVTSRKRISRVPRIRTGRGAPAWSPPEVGGPRRIQHVTHRLPTARLADDVQTGEVAPAGGTDDDPEHVRCHRLDRIGGEVQQFGAVRPQGGRPVKALAHAVHHAEIGTVGLGDGSRLLLA
jgi:hypothetical protein